MEKGKIRSLLRTAYQEHNIKNFNDLQAKYMADKFIKGCEDCRAPWEVRALGPIVKAEVWRKIAQGDYQRTLCKECMEWRLGRKIKPDDLELVAWNILRKDITEGKVMANRNIQAKRLKIKRHQKTVPKYLSQEAVNVQRYNSTSPYAMKNRKFLPPDAVDRSNPNGIEYGQIPVTINAEFNNFALCQVHTDQKKDLEDIALEGWSSWNAKGTAQYARKTIRVWPRLKRLDCYFSGDRVYLIEENYSLGVIRRSCKYRSIELAELAANSSLGPIWKETVPLNKST